MAISSSFDTGTEGWTIQGGGSGPAYVTDGSGGGFIRATDTASDTFFFNAPASFLGNKTAYFGGTLSFQLRRSDGAEWNEPQDVILTSGGGKTIYAVLPARPDPTLFTTYTYRFDTSGDWKLASGAAASASDILEVLADLSKLLIVGDLVSGIDSTDLDSVMLDGAAAVQRFESDPAGGNPGGVFSHSTLAEALVAASSGQWITVNDAASPGGLHTVTVDDLHLSAPEGFAAQLFLASGVKTLELGGAAYFQVAGNAAANVLFGNDAGNALSGNAGNDTLRGGDGTDSLDGGRGRDTIYGGNGNDAINGGLDNDKLRGDSGIDAINGGSGNDAIIGGSGKDTLTGEAGSDRFVFTSVKHSQGTNADVITDFTVDTAGSPAFIDLIDVSAIDAVAGVSGNQSFAFIGQSAISGEGQVRAVQRGADTLVLFNTQGGPAAEMQILLRNFTATSLTDADFVL